MFMGGTSFESELVMPRDNFTDKTKRDLAERAHYLCSNPECRKQTFWPKLGKQEAFTTGEAAHIRAAAQKGPRYDRDQSEDERSSIANAIWLCVECATRIDKDQEAYPVETLQEWKQRHEGFIAKGFTVFPTDSERSHGLVKMVSPETLNSVRGDTVPNVSNGLKPEQSQFDNEEKQGVQRNPSQLDLFPSSTTATKLQPDPKPQAAVEPRLQVEPGLSDSPANETPRPSAVNQSTMPSHVAQSSDIAQPHIGSARKQALPASPPLMVDQRLIQVTEKQKPVHGPIRGTPPPIIQEGKSRKDPPKRPNHPTSDIPNSGKGGQKATQSRYMQMIIACILLVTFAGFWTLPIAGFWTLPATGYNKPDFDLPSFKNAKPEKNHETRRLMSPTFVCLIGQVTRPGVYEFDSTRLTGMQLIQKAGGLTNGASAQFQVIRDSRTSDLLDQAGTDKFQLQPGDLVVAESQNIINANLASVQIGFVNLLDHPVVLNLPIERASLTSILQSLNQNSLLATQVRVVLPPNFKPQKQLHPDVLLPSESVIIFPQNSVARDQLPKI